MRTLVRLELQRFWSRQIVRMALFVVSGLILVYGGVQLFTHSSEAPDTASVEAQVEREISQCRVHAAEEWEFAQSGESFGDPGYEEYLAQFDSAEGFAAEQCHGSFFGGFVEERRFCYASMWRRGHDFYYLCPDVDREALFGSEFGGFEGGFFLEEEFLSEGTGRSDPDAEARATTVINGRTYQLPRDPDSGTLVGTSLSLMIVAIVFGATFVGAEYKAGTIENQLLWEPRRSRVISAKFIAVATSSALAHVALLILLMVATLPAATFSGTFAGVDGTFWRGASETIARGSLAAGLVAVAAAALAFIVRNTAGSVGVILGYGIIGTGLVFFFASALVPWEIATNSNAFVLGADVPQLLGNRFENTVYHHGPWTAGLIALTYTSLLVTFAVYLFKRRDID